MSTQRVLTLAYVVLAILVGLTLEQLFREIFEAVGFLAFLNQDLFGSALGSGSAGWSWATLLGFAIAAGVAVYCWVAPSVRTPATQVVEELRRVTWPTFIETRANTWAVIIATIIAAALLGAFDYGWGMLTHQVYSP